jgi:tetratricopeptide (TPR) repeat protein
MEGNAELLALQRLDETCAQLQKQGNYLEALECMERGLVLRQHFFGSDSDEVWSACKTVGEMCNLLAMTYLQQEDFNMVLELLKKAEILTEKDAAGRAATFNNLACYYRRQGKLHAALQYLQKALKIEAKLTNVQNPADTHINACAVLSQLGRHQTALEHAQNALILLQEELLSPPGAAGTSAPPQADRIAVLAIAYHNIGVEQEFLKRYEQSMLSYRKGVEVAERYLGAKHPICITLKNSLVAAKKTASAEASKGLPSKQKKGVADKIQKISKAPGSPNIGNGPSISLEAPSPPAPK